MIYVLQAPVGDLVGVLRHKDPGRRRLLKSKEGVKFASNFERL